MNIQEILKSIAPEVKEAGIAAKQLMHSAKIVGHKPSDDLVTEGDLLVEDMILGVLRERFPDHGFDSEEAGKENADKEFVWVLDPIDGTKYYARKNPLYCVSLALQQKGESVLGVIYLPETDQLLTAAKGQGTFLNGKRVKCSGIANLTDAIICVEIPSRNASQQRLSKGMEQFSDLVRHAQRVRIIGAGAVGLALASTGAFDAYISLSGSWKLCDVAAGDIMIREAGGQYTVVDNKLFAGPASLCEQVMQIVSPSSLQP